MLYKISLILSTLKTLISQNKIKAKTKRESHNFFEERLKKVLKFNRFKFKQATKATQN